jgi:acyl carrier protein
MAVNANTTQRLAELLRTTVIGDSDREIEANLPLGADGVGLDSLAMVQFLTTVESEFGLAIPNDVWESAAELSLDQLAHVVQDAMLTG